MSGWFNQVINDKKRLFWTLQISGWTGFAILRFLNGISYIYGYPFAYIYPTIVAALTGFLLTLVIRQALKLVWHRGLLPALLVAVPLTAVASAVFSAVELSAHVMILDPEPPLQGWEFIGNAFYDAAILLAWVGLYFGISYHWQLRGQTERMLKITSMAHQAQLKMLRYQLNPHFLFNTLNAISTLVLAKESQQANEMLNRLSAFLRYTLVNQPAHKVTLEQELHAIGLYLDIEKARFEDRLNLEIEASAEAEQAYVPSLLLQPLIENAIKYAIAPSENGGAIRLRARVLDGRLDVVMADDGPGLPEGFPKPSTSHFNPQSSGVGIANIKERLRQFYGEDYIFDMRNIRPHGLEVRINIPYETQLSDDDRIAA